MSRTETKAGRFGEDGAHYEAGRVPGQVDEDGRPDGAKFEQGIAQKHTHGKGVDKLQHIAVDESEKQGLDGNGHPWLDGVQQLFKDKASEQYLFVDRGDNAHSKKGQKNCPVTICGMGSEI